MAIPDFQSVMLPLMETLVDGQERTMRALTDLLAGRFGLTEAERQELLPSGQQSLFSNRVAWSKSHLKYAGLLENPARGRVRISELGDHPAGGRCPPSRQPPGVTCVRERPPLDPPEPAP